MPKWRASACRCRPASPSRPRSAPTTTPTTKQYPKDLKAQVEKALAQVGKLTGKIFGDTKNPLLVSVRSGARASMPGMMDTVLNLGLNDETVEAIAANSGDKRFAYDCYRRFITMYSDVVLGVDHHHFEELLDRHKEQQGYSLDTDLTADDWAALIVQYKKRVQEEHGKPFPQDPHEQLWGAIGAVFGSWMNQRAITYRRLHNIPESWGTAVNVQAMVFGNMGETSATGVAFTRNPSTGEKKLYGEFLINAQGEDVVAGIRTPQEISEAARLEAGSDKPSMEKCAARRHLPSCSASTTSSRSTTATCRTSSSRSSRASCGCCRPAPASAPPKRRSASRSSSPMRS